jgi:general secretion pathway protein A
MIKIKGDFRDFHAFRNCNIKKGLKNTILKEIKWEFVPGINAPEPDKEPVILRPYLDYYGLMRPPFTITPDPEFLYSSSTHKSALENILYGIEAGMGFILLTGEVGTGKTTLCRAVLDNLEGKAETVYIINPSLSGMEIIEAILDDLDIDYPRDSSKKVLVDLLNRFLLDTTRERPVVIIIDDAQTMTPDGLENLRLLSNLETDKKKLLQIVLTGQPELQKMLSQPGLRQLRQRITVSCTLGIITYSELEQYISLRLFVAGSRGNLNFTSGAIKRIYRASCGIPRLINIICDYALMAGYVSNSPIIRKKETERAIRELRSQGILEKRTIIDASTPVSGKRVRMELFILLISLLILVVIYSNKTPLDKGGQADHLRKTAQTTITYVPDPEANALIDAVPINYIIGNKTVNEPIVAAGKPVLPESNGITSGKASKNYIVQLFSYKTLEDAERGALALRKTGLDVHWSPVHMTTNGTWYRVYQGGFESEDEAKDFIEKQGLREAVILYAPWTVVITAGKVDKSIEDIRLALNEKGYDPVIEGDINSVPRLSLGAYISPEGLIGQVRK